VLPETAEHFVPLWLGLERVGAIDFKKGCYTGQEIVARTHYLGQAKQQLHRARCAQAAEPGTKLFAGGDQSIGEVVIAAPAGAAHALLFVGREAPAGAVITLAAASGAPLSEVAPAD
jgi:folate-binding protein YgfZ